MNEGYEHTSGNQVNIPIKLCVHPNIISKGIKTWIKRSLRVITWLGYKRNVICGAIEIKKPNKEKHSLYQPLNSTIFPTNHYKPLVLKHEALWSWQLIFFLDFSFFFSFSFSFHVHIVFLFFCIYNNMLSWSKINLHHSTWHKIYIYLLSPTWINKYPNWMFLYSKAKGTNNIEI